MILFTVINKRASFKQTEQGHSLHLYTTEFCNWFDKRIKFCMKKLIPNTNSSLFEQSKNNKGSKLLFWQKVKCKQTPRIGHVKKEEIVTVKQTYNIQFIHAA